MSLIVLLGKIVNFLLETPGCSFFFTEETHAITARPRLHSFLSARRRHAQKNAEDVTRGDAAGKVFLLASSPRCIPCAYSSPLTQNMRKLRTMLFVYHSVLRYGICASFF